MHEQKGYSWNYRYIENMVLTDEKITTLDIMLVWF